MNRNILNINKLLYSKMLMLETLVERGKHE
jgi:hypothetical protein